MDDARGPRRGRRRLSIVNEDAAGVDVGATFTSSRSPPIAMPSRSAHFRVLPRTCTRWQIGSSPFGFAPSPWSRRGVYWIPIYEILEHRGFEVLLVNARNTRNVPGRKTNVNDAQWRQQLHQHGLLRASFRPRRVAQLRAYLRHLERLLDHAASHIQHMQKVLIQMNV
jgi:hypothetical protein